MVIHFCLEPVFLKFSRDLGSEIGLYEAGSKEV